MSAITEHKPVIGLTCGDVNGIGIELIIKTLGDNRILDTCTPVIFANNKVLNFYRKGLSGYNLNFISIRELNRVNHKQLNLFSCWEEEVNMNPGILNAIGGEYAIKSLTAAAQALKENKIDGLVTAPIHKNNTQSEKFNFTGHTPYLKNLYGVNEVAMMMVAENMRVALLTEHLPVKEVAQKISKEAIISKLQVINNSLKRDFNINKPRIAVLGLNPHAGDEGLIGKEEEEIIKPAIKEAKHRDVFCFGPYSADAFFARGQHEKFDAVLAMYHDQGLIPFKSLAIGEGVNYTAGLPGVRTSPDHGVAFDIAGQGKADESSFRAAIFQCVDIILGRREYDEQYSNPLKKMSASVLRNAVDEKVSDIPE
ncbi:MAG TPA: 4-hydroxythreonine-4-phosphate dehydrogenase PdxA [Ferruginibacter sp.]|jgi:4-hydroxythreonine-4-phosphate dehydrogenase|nr:4-hydroxythreonine-4-phosphate dehydrogenase PdxA [Ferruginibacter sp.]MBN8698379.1 4-hydroxythreonine-4-phosphate dehydrogenase PdxA [Chitinophagales bacterium]HMW25135.1 4-hydroxythreonine-4-phosphate dehydrogenase PdxA [Ferruginibacter sp.]HNA00710.1 4-hydroxythreonine-4-phosphate dehydrogenase PdxA [Ferruginibacter sp.]HNA15642.1 4-hydroxythreonine-4-phosphate dehydrogenase PdxA [Ferruginibacter sp.]